MDHYHNKRIRQYEILNTIGSGGMGVVFKAKDRYLQRLVVLKLLHPSKSSDPVLRDRFLREARAQASLSHSNIVHVHDLLAYSKNEYFIVMEYINGTDLSSFLRDRWDGRLPWKDAVNCISQVMRAVDFTHSVNILHRDIKPRNILVPISGPVKLTDFGLAKMDNGREVTRTADAVGTVYYMAPEIVEHSLPAADQRSDIYSLGMTLYEMLTGKVPFDKSQNDYNLQRHIVEGEITPLPKLVPDVPWELTKVVMKCLAKNPDKRYQSVREMQAALNRFQSLQKEKANIKTSEPENWWDKVQVKWSLMAILLLLIVLLIVKVM